YVAVAGGGLGDLRGLHLGDGVFVGRVGEGQHLADAGDLRGFGGDGGWVGGQHQHVDVATDGGGGRDGLGDGAVELAVQVFGDDENLGHWEFLNGFRVGAHLGAR